MAAMAVAAATLLTFTARAWHDTMAEPVVCGAMIALPTYAADAAPQTIQE